MGGLNSEDARNIKDAYREGSLSVAQIARKYTVSYMTVYRVAIGKTWAHISPTPQPDAPEDDGNAGDGYGQSATCGECGADCEVARPGKFQCPECE